MSIWNLWQRKVMKGADLCSNRGRFPNRIGDHVVHRRGIPGDGQNLTMKGKRGFNTLHGFRRDAYIYNKNKYLHIYIYIKIKTYYKHNMPEINRTCLNWTEFKPFETFWRATNSIISIIIDVSPWILLIHGLVLMAWRLKLHVQLQQTKLAIASNDYGPAQNKHE